MPDEGAGKIRRGRLQGARHLISDIRASSALRPRGRPRTRIEVGEVPRLHLPSMIAAGEVVPGEAVRTARSWSNPDGTKLLVTVVAEMKADRGQLVVQPFAGWSYTVKVVSDLQPFGGRRWWMVCPVTGRRVSGLYLPAGATRFASREAHGLTYRTQRLDARGRAIEREAKGQRAATR